MNKLFPRFSLRRFRTHLALLLAYLTLITPLSPVFAQAMKVKRAAAPATTQGTEQPGKGKGTTVGIDKHITLPAPNGAVTAPVITATKTDNLSASTQVAPGGTINYTVTITNSGTADATGVVFNDTVDTNTTVDASSAVLAADDDYNTIGNVQISIAAPGLLANDLDIDAGNNTGMTTTAETKSSASCASCNNVTINTDGSFTYDPPVGFNGTDTFTYTAHTAGGKSATATAHVTATGRIWFVNNNAGACSSACDGRLSHPFTSLANFQAINDNAATLTHAKTGDNIFIYESSTDYTGPVTLLSSQKLIGQDATATIETITGLSTPSGATVLPAMNATPATIVNITSATNDIDLGSGNTLRGFTAGNALIAISGSSFGTLTTAADVTINTNGQALSLTTGTVKGTLGSVSSGGGTNGVLFSGVTVDAGGFGATGGTLTGASGSTFSVTGGSGGTLTWAGAINQASGAAAVTIASSNSNTINFSGNVTTSGTSTGINISGSSGTYNFTGSTSTITGTGGGVTIVNESGTISFGSGYSINGPTTSFKIGGTATTTTASITYSGTITNNVNGGTLLDINSSAGTYSTGTITFNGTSLSGTVSGSSGVISVIKNMTGTLTVNHLSLTSSSNSFSNTLVAISGTNTGGSFTFNNLNLSATGTGHTGKGLTASGGGTLTVTATGGSSSIDVSSTALDINGLAIGTSTIATVNSSGGTNGVSFTSSSGTLTMSGGTLSGSSVSEFFVSGGSPTITYSGSVTQSNTDTGRLVDIQNTTGGTITFNTGTLTGGTSGTGVNINAANGNVTFSNGMTIGTSAARYTNATPTPAVTIAGGTGTYSLGAVSIFTSGSGVQGIVATNADGTINCSSTSTVDASGATAININGPAGLTTLGMTLTKVSSGGGTNGIAIQNTGGSFTINGDGTNNASGGTIQNSTGDGVLLANAQNISLTSMSIQNTVKSGVSGSNNVQNFTFDHGTINNSGTADNTTFRDSNIAFNKGETAPTIGNEKNITGTLTVTNSTLTNSFFHGVVVSQFDGTLSNINISNNTITSSTSQATSKGQGIKLIGFGSASTVANFSKATINNNHITNFPSDAGILIQGGNGTSAAAPAGVYGSDISTNAIQITNNVIAGQSAAAGIGTQGILTATNGKGSGFFVITGNSITNVLGIGIATGANGDASYTGIITGNTINAHNINNSAGIGGGTTNTFGTSDTPTYNVKIGDGTVAGENNISNTFGNGILINSINGVGHTNVRILKNIVAVPIESPPSGTVYGIRVAEGNVNSSSDSICLDISGNTTAGNDDGAGTHAPGIGLRKQTAAQVFGIVGMAATSSPGVENFVNGQNPGSASGSFGTGGTALISATTGFSNCSEPAVLARATMIEANPHGVYLAQERDAFRNSAPFSLFSTDTGDVASLISSFSPASIFAPSASTPVSDGSTQIVAASNNTLDGSVHAAVNAAATLNAQASVASDSAPREWSDIPASSAHRAARQINAAYTDDTASSSGGVRFANASYTSSDAINRSRVSRVADYIPPAMQQSQAAQKLESVAQTGTPSSKPSRPLAVLSSTAVSANIGTLKAGDSVQINFSVTVKTPFPNGVSTVSNQGTISGSNFTSVLTDDPDVGTNGPTEHDPTVTQILTPPDIRANDAKVAEPASGQQTTMLFVVTLNHAFPPTGTSVNFATANGGATPAVGGASCDGSTDYVTNSGTLSFSGSETLKTIPVTVCGTSIASDKTLLLNLSSPSAGQIIRAQAVGTITAANQPGTFLVTELRTSGPDPDGAGPLTGADNDFVELYNNTDSPLTVQASDASAGYGVFKMGADCNAAPVLIATIPNNTVIPARGHYLLVGTGYSLKDYGGTNAAAGDQTLTANIETDANVAVFTTADAANVSTFSRLDAVGYGANTGGNSCDLLREGATLAPIAANATTEHSYFRNLTTGQPKDTNDNASDFIFADTQGTFISGVTQQLGAPGPENKTSPINRGATIKAALLDSTVGSSTSPNRVRNTSATGTNAAAGTLSIRRRFTNNTGGNVTRLRFRVVQVTTFPSPGGGVADVRLLTSSDLSQGGINDATTCGGATPCTVTVRGTTLESPPTQPNGGGLNSTVAAGIITVGTPLAPGASVNVQFLLGVQTTGNFAFFVIVEGLP